MNLFDQAPDGAREDSVLSGDTLVLNLDDPKAEGPVTEAIPEALQEQDESLLGELHSLLDGEPKPDPASKPLEQSVIEAPGEEPAPSVSYESMAEAAERVKAESTDSNLDDDTLLEELYALIGDGKKAPVRHDAEATPVKQVQPEPAKITPEDLKDVPEEQEEDLEQDTAGVPGWVKGIFLLLISLLLGGMTLYAVAADVLGKVF